MASLEDAISYFFRGTMLDPVPFDSGVAPSDLDEDDNGFGGRGLVYGHTADQYADAVKREVNDRFGHRALAAEDTAYFRKGDRTTGVNRSSGGIQWSTMERHRQQGPVAPAAHERYAKRELEGKLTESARGSTVMRAVPSYTQVKRGDKVPGADACWVDTGFLFDGLFDDK